MNRKAFEKMNYGLYLVSAANDGKRHGCIVSSFAQVTSAQPPKVTVTLNKEHETCKAIQAAGSFSVTMLAAACPKELVDQFGYKSGRVGDKFTGRDVKTDENGNPYITDHMAARVACKVVNQVEVGNYILFVAEATEAEVLSDSAILTLSDFTNKGKPVPPTATVYRTVEINGYRCTVCGYVHEAEFLPADFRCPICNAPAEKFEKIEK